MEQPSNIPVVCKEACAWTLVLGFAPETALCHTAGLAHADKRTHLFAMYIVSLINGAFTCSLTGAHTWPVFVTWALLSLPASRGKQSLTTNCPWEHISAFVKCVYPFSRLLSVPLFPPRFPPFPMAEVVKWRWGLHSVSHSFSLPLCQGRAKGERDRVCWTEFDKGSETMTGKSRDMERWRRKLAGSSSLWY